MFHPNEMTVSQAIVDTVGEQLAAGVTGIAVSAVRDSEVVFSAGFGVADVDESRPVSVEAAFAAQSVTKAVLATAIMRFVESGALRLDDPVNGHLGAIRLANRWEETHPVTIGQLLTHTAGIPEGCGWHSTTSVEDEVANHLSTSFEPGSRLIYANGGYDVLGCVLTQLAGRAWDRAVSELVLEPLGMWSSAVGSPPQHQRDRTVGHVLSQADGSALQVLVPPWPYDPPPPSGSLSSTAEDLAHFLLAHLEGGGGILSEKSVADMHRLHAPLGPGGGGMGLGFRVDRRGDRPFFCHGGDGLGFTTFVGGHPHERVGVVVLINTGGAQQARSMVVRAALDALLDRERRSRTAPPPARSRLPAELDGGYRSTYWGIRAELEQHDDGPSLTVSGSVLSGEMRSKLDPTDGRWLGRGGMFDGWELDLLTDADGKGRIFGGVYPFELIADDTAIVRLPKIVNEDGDANGNWSGTADTPYGIMPIELSVTPAAAAVTIPWFSSERLPLSDAELSSGWLTGWFNIEVPGIGTFTISLRLGLTNGRLQGILHARSDLGQFPIPTALEHEVEQPQGDSGSV